MKKPRYKLNLLGPGLKICGACGILLLLGILMRLFGLAVFGNILFLAAAVLFLILLILVGIEQRQDNKLYLQAKKEDPDIK